MNIADKFLQIQFGDLPPERLIAGLFEIPRIGYVYFDLGWDQMDAKPYHEIGTLIESQAGRWVFQGKDGLKTTITEIEEDDPLYDDAEDWFYYAKGLDNSKMIEGLKKDFDLSPDSVIKSVWVYPKQQ
jgi:hypothetical protein